MPTSRAGHSKPVPIPRPAAAAERALQRRNDAELRAQLRHDPVGQRGWIGDPWERQPHETDREWGAWLIYRDTDPSERAYWKVELELAERRDLAESTKEKLKARKNATGRFLRVTTRWRWGERVEAYDNYMDQQVVLARTRERSKAAARQAKQAATVGEVLAHPAELLAKRIRKAIEAGEESTEAFANLDDKELLALVRMGAKNLADMQKEERAALGTDDDGGGGDNKELQLRGMVLRQVIDDPENIGALEKLAFDIRAKQLKAEKDEQATG